MKKNFRGLYFTREAPFAHENDIRHISNDITHLEDGWERWSFPLGNGYAGTVLLGRVKTDRIQLTEKSFGNCYYCGVGRMSLGGVQNFCDVFLDFDHSLEETEGYERYLDISTGIATLNYSHGGVKYTREYFMSYPDKVLAVKLTASEKGKISFTLRPEIPFIGHVFKEFEGKPYDDKAERTGSLHADTVDNGGVTEGRITLDGHLEWFDVTGAANMRLIPYGENAKITSSNAECDIVWEAEDKMFHTVGGSTVTVSDADEAVLLICLGTDYEMHESIFTEEAHEKKMSAFRKTDAYVPAREKVDAQMLEASKYTYDELKQRHLDDVGEILQRVEVTLGGEWESTTDELVKGYDKSTGENGEYTDYDKKRDLFLEELQFLYGRYLLLSSSRKGTLPSNLQGAWTRYQLSPWGCGMWHNINEQQNYWPAYVTSIPESFDGYLDYWKAYLPASKLWTSKLVNRVLPKKYGRDGSNGWTIATGAYPWDVSASRGLGNMGLTIPMFWDYYDFSGDPEKLKEIFPALYDAMAFMTKSVVKRDGKYLSMHGDSAEQHVNGVWYYTEGTTYDQAGLYYVGEKLLEAAKLLGYKDSDYPVIKRVKQQIKHYDQCPVGYSGHIKEFREEKYYGELGEYQHRHISQLIGLYPCDTITTATPAWLDAAGVALKERGGTGIEVGPKMGAHGIVHRLPAWARLKDGETSHLFVKEFLTRYIGTNLWSLGNMFQIDGDLGYTGAMAEMLLQSHEGYIDVIPAIPKKWANGYFNGLSARGGYSIDAVWRNKCIKSVTVKAGKFSKECKIKLGCVDNVSVKCGGKTVKYKKLGDGIIAFKTEPCGTYVITGMKPVTLPKAPTGFAVKSNTKAGVTLKWRKCPGAVSYNLYYANESAADYTLYREGITENTALFEIKDESEMNIRRTYRLCAVDKNGLESRGALCYTVPIEK